MMSQCTVSLVRTLKPIEMPLIINLGAELTHRNELSQKKILKFSFVESLVNYHNIHMKINGRRKRTENGVLESSY